MNELLQRWARFDRRFNPASGISGAEFDHLFVPLPDSPARDIVTELEKWRATLDEPQPDPAPQFLFCGARGSGKSTQLLYIHRELLAGWEVVSIDMGPVLPERPGTLFFIALAGFVAAARLREHKSRPMAALAKERSAIDKMTSAVRALAGAGLDVEQLIDASASLATAAPGAGSLVGAGARLLDRLLPLRPLTISSINDRVTVDRDASATELLTAVNAVIEELHGVSGKPVLFLADGLDKANTADRALGLFDDAPLLRRLSASLVLTGPVHLRHDHRILAVRQSLPVHLLFNVPVVDRAGADRDSGADVLRSMVRRRVPADLAGAIDDDALAAAVRASSGMPRELFRILTQASTAAVQGGSARMEMRHVDGACRQVRLLLQQTLTTEDLRVLERTLTHGRAGETERERDLLYENYIVCYANGDTWFRPHELLVDWVKREAPPPDPEPGLLR